MNDIHAERRRGSNKSKNSNDRVILLIRLFRYPVAPTLANNIATTGEKEQTFDISGGQYRCRSDSNEDGGCDDYGKD